ncbi:MAG: 5'/3'-nucleotidase SurE, partial [Thiohalomonadales bacterium]
WQALSDIATVTVVAPDRNRSGASNSLTLDNPLRAQKQQNGFISVDGTPTDCVHLAITGLLDVEPDMVIAGINAGANLGDDVIYSGTVAAAVEGRFLGLPAIAVSLVGETLQHYATAAQAVRRLVEKLQHEPLPKDSILNVNVPDVPWSDIQGMLGTRLGSRHKSEPVVKFLDPRGRTVYWVGPVGAEQDAGPETDFYAVANNYVSVTPIQVDLTRHESVASISAWLGNIALAP